MARLGPGKGLAGEWLVGVALVLLLGGSDDVVLDELGVWQVEDLDSLLGGDEKPEKLWREEDAVDWRIAILVGEPLSANNVPDHNHTVVGAGSEVGRVVNEIEGGDLRVVSLEGVEQAHVGVVPNLDGLIPRGSHAKSWLLGVVESHNRDGISVLIFFNSVFALRTGVPDLDLLVETSSNDLSVVSGKVNGEDVTGMSNELGDGSSGLHVPETNSSVPGGRESVARVSSKFNLGNEVRMTSHHFLWLAKSSLSLKFSILGDVPLDKSLIAGSRKEELNFLTIDFLDTDNERGDPATVTYFKHAQLISVTHLEQTNQEEKIWPQNASLLHSAFHTQILTAQLRTYPGGSPCTSARVVIDFDFPLDLRWPSS